MSVNSINDLPIELLVHIFSLYIKTKGQKVFARNIPLVCKRWKDLYSTPLLWRDVNYTYQLFTLGELNKLSERGFLSSTRGLRVRYVYAHEENQFVNLMLNCRNLRELSVTGRYHLTKFLMEVLQEQCPNIESLELRTIETTNANIGDVLCPFLSVRGQNLKRLHLSHKLSSDEKHLVPTMAGYCHALEQLEFDCYSQNSSRIQLPINEIVIGCPKMRKLRIFDCDMISSVQFGNHNGFEVMVSFEAMDTDFHGVDVCSLLKRSKELECLEIYYCRNVLFSSVSMLLSDRMRVFSIKPVDDEFPNLNHLVFLQEVMGKWKRTLTKLHLPGANCVANSALELHLRGNPYPNLKDVDLSHCEVSEELFEKMLTTFRNLNHLCILKPYQMELQNRCEIADRWTWHFIGDVICLYRR